MDAREISIIYHVGIVLGVLWICSCFNWCHPILFFLSLIYLYMVHDCYIVRLRKKLQFEERKQAYQKRVLSDSESVRWLNHAVEKIWPVCMEQIASQKILLPIIPWFLEKYKPWTAKKAVVQSLYLGRNPPMITEMRVLRQCSDDDHLVMELGMNFLTADDMSAILAVQLRRRLGFGMWAKLHVTGMHVEGKVLVGVKFLREWPFLGRLRVCFVEPPYFQMTVKPIVSHGLDVTELPGIAGWLDKLLSVAFEQTLVEPNMLVVDMEKFASGSTTESWFTVDEKDPIAYAKVEVIEAADMKPSDPNGLADPYVKGQLGPYRFRTKIQKKTLAPKWQEEFKIPICSWDSPNVLALEVRDKDHFVDDILGDCVVNINDAKDGQRRDMWIPLQNIKMGRLHLAVTVRDVNAKGEDCKHDENALDKKESTNTIASEPIKDASKPIASSKTSQRVADDFEPINVEGQQQTGIWVHHPGSDVSQTWEPRKRNRMADIQIPREDNDSVDTPRSRASGTNNTCDSSSEENLDGNKSKSLGSVRRSIRKIGSVFRSPKGDAPCILEEPSPRHVNIRAENEKPPILNIIRDSDTSGAAIGSKELSQTLSPERNETAVAGKGHMKVMAKSILKHAGNGLKHALSRKGSKKTRGDITMGTDSDSSEYSLSSSSMHYRSTDGDTSSELAPNSPNGMKSPDPKERTVHSSTDELTTVKNVSFKGGDITIPDVHQEEPPNPDVHREETPIPDIHREDTASPVGHGGQLDTAIIDKTSQENR